jgi:hypothetical protein
MSWDPCFQSAEFRPVHLISHPETTISVSGYRNLKVYHPGYENISELFVKKPESLENFRLDTQFHWVKQGSPAKKGEVKILVQQANTKQPPREQTAYCKIVHCLDPMRWMKGKYEMGLVALDKNHTKRWERTQKKLLDPMNQAYVEALACYLLGKCREADISPHFSLFYGSLQGIADTYDFNVTEDFQSFRNYDWFWHGKEKKWFDLQIESSSLSPEEKQEWIQKPDDILLDSYSVSSSSTKSSSKSSEEIVLDSEVNNETESIGSMKTANLSFHSDNASNHSDEDLSDDDNDDGNFIEIQAQFHDFPVILMFLEKSEGTMDDLLNHEEFEPQWEKKWAAWIFQVIAGLCVLQHQFSMTHNDLHTNNIVWTKTNQQFLYYKSKSGGYTWKVPTYGKLMRIIDFGRAIFRVKDKVIYSDDFVHNNDAGEQYNFGPLLNSEKPVVTPNPSFDLCRLAVSLFESLYSEEPQMKENGEILSSEPGLEVRETTSDLFNCMWKWMVTDSKENVLVTPDGDEKYPDFDLYKVISTSCHNAIPKEQLHKKPFSQFLVQKPKLQAGTKVYNLFC